MDLRAFFVLKFILSEVVLMNENEKNAFLVTEPPGKLMKKYSLPCVISLLVVVLGVGLALLLPLRFGLDGVLLSMPVADIITFAVSIIIVLRTFRELDRGIAKAA